MNNLTFSLISHLIFSQQFPSYNLNDSKGTLPKGLKFPLYRVSFIKKRRLLQTGHLSVGGSATSWNNMRLTMEKRRYQLGQRQYHMLRHWHYIVNKPQFTARKVAILLVLYYCLRYTSSVLNFGPIWTAHSNQPKVKLEPIRSALVLKELKIIEYIYIYIYIYIYM